MPKVHFSDYFNVSPAVLTRYGAFNVSLVSDLPLFVDPFLLFNSKKQKYQELHEAIIAYVRFLRDRSATGELDGGLLKAWFMFSEVRQTWLGYSTLGNRGSGLGSDFASALNRNLNTIFTNFGQEHVARASHLEKLCLVRRGVGRDNISDFTTNLIKEFLLEYTQTFARAHLATEQRREFSVGRVRFNYETETWASGVFELPVLDDDYVLLTPRDILTKDETWINRGDFIDNFEMIARAISNDQLRAEVNNYFLQQLSKEPKRKERREAAARALEKFPDIIEHYIRYKEDHGDEAVAVSREKVTDSETLYVSQVRALINRLGLTAFYQQGTTYSDTHARVQFLKTVIEDQDGYRTFYVNGQPVRAEKDLQLLFRLTWFGTRHDVNQQVNNGRGPADTSISFGSADKTLVEFKLASNSKLLQNLKHQAEIYARAGSANRSIKVILFFTAGERARVEAILKELKLESNPDIVLIDARSDNKVSASKATDATEAERL